MEPEYRDGDFVVVDTSRRPESGICCILLDVDGEREAVLKNLAIRGATAYLKSLNPDMKPRALPAKKILAAYEIVGHLKR
jgi:SOS-response transcriptional repressor LexA